MPEPPATDEGWYALHDFRTIDWDAWRAASDEERSEALEEGRSFLEAAEAVEDAEEGASASYVVVGHKADLMLLHLRPTLGDVDALERRFEGTGFARFTEQSSSYVSVTEASGYTAAQDYFDPDAEADPGIRNYIQSRLYPDLPDAEFVSFYPMSKRRDPEYNWYDLPFEERAEHMGAHGDIGRDYAGRVVQIVSGSVGLDDFEWGVTLFADDPTDVKELLYEMRFDPSTSKYAEFGPFYSGRRFPPSDLEAVLAGERVPTESLDDETADEGLVEEIESLGADLPGEGHAVLVRSSADEATVGEEVDGLRGNFEHYDTHVSTTVYGTDDGAAVVSIWETESAANTASGFLAELEGVTETQVGSIGGSSEAAASHQEGERGGHPHGSSSGDADAGSIREELRERGIYAGQPHGEDVHALVLYSEADVEDLEAEVGDLAEGFDRYDTHVGTDVYEAPDAPPAVVSLWETADAAETAAGYLEDLPEVVRQAGEGEGFGTMGMFYTVEPDAREAFVEKFEEVGALLEGMDGHVETDLYANREDENEMFIASRWESREDCMAFFRSDEFSETVDWGRDVLTDRPRHVFLA